MDNSRPIADVVAPVVCVAHEKTLYVASSEGIEKCPAVCSKTCSTSTLVDVNHVPQLSTPRLLAAHVGAALTLFLATTDSTIVSTTLPTISSEFSASQLEYTWVGVSYMLTQTAFQPLYGKLSDLIGRKTVLYGSMVLFVVGSLLCGAAQSMIWLILARALAGIGGGGIVSLVWTITSEIVDLQSRAKWSQALSITWSCSAVAGPLLGGVFSGQNGTLSWRWAFYLNLPVCLVALIVLYISLRGVQLGSSKDTSWKAFGRTFDFLGLTSFMCGSSCLVIGFSFASDLGWTSPLTSTLIICGTLVLGLGGVYEIKTKRDALFPRSIFTDTTTVISLTINFLHNLAFTAGTYYLALYFQSVNGLSPLSAGIAMLPYSLGSSVASMPTAWFISYRQAKTCDTTGQKYVICIGLATAAVAFGLMISVDEKSPQILQYLYPLLAGIGLGMLFHAPYQVFSRALRATEMASGTSAFFLVRFTGATIGLSVAGAAFNSRLSQTLPGVGPSLDLEHLNLVQPPAFRAQAIHGVAVSIQISQLSWSSKPNNLLQAINRVLSRFGHPRMSSSVGPELAPVIKSRGAQKMQVYPSKFDSSALSSRPRSISRSTSSSSVPFDAKDVDVVRIEGLRHASGTLEARRYKTPEFAEHLLSILHALRMPVWCNHEITPQTLKIQKVSGSLTNAVFFVSCPSIPRVPIILLRIYGPSSGSLISRPRELHTLHILSSQYHIGPKVYGTFENGRVEEYFDSAALTAEDMRDPIISSWIGARMAELHQVDVDTIESQSPPSSPVPSRPTRAGDVWQIGVKKNVKSWLAAAREVLALPTVSEQLRIALDLDAFGQEWERYLSWLSNFEAQVGASPVVFCHNDAQYGNLLRMTRLKSGVPEHRQIIVVDFEYASPNPAAFDIANHFHEWTANYHGENPHLLKADRYPTLEQRYNFFAAYLTHYHHLNASISRAALESKMKILDEQVRAWSPASHAMWAVWGIVQAREALEGEDGDPEFDYIEYSRCRLEGFRREIRALSV
ncbi:hypothetical protein NM688_g1790 [Phlebia brevispora]|uniref:Uncharacterized protein n=1 Tax=Phlebia brevispora TaxID=194682 RepID=A0ACC1TAI2_9APHY|nr:hypothetical protein NM688_g1790 [Phlebia brevispora]